MAYLCITTEYDTGAVYSTKQPVNLYCIQSMDWDNLPPHTNALYIWHNAVLLSTVNKITRLSNLPYYISRLYIEYLLEICGNKCMMWSKQCRFIFIIKLCGPLAMCYCTSTAQTYYNFSEFNCNSLMYNGFRHTLYYSPMLDMILLHTFAMPYGSIYKDYMPHQLLHYSDTFQDIYNIYNKLHLSDNMPPNCSIKERGLPQRNKRNDMRNSIISLPLVTATAVQHHESILTVDTYTPQQIPLLESNKKHSQQTELNKKTVKKHKLLCNII